MFALRSLAAHDRRFVSQCSGRRGRLCGPTCKCTHRVCGCVCVCVCGCLVRCAVLRLLLVLLVLLIAGVQKNTCARHGLQIMFRINVHSSCNTNKDLAMVPPLSEHWHQTLERPPTNWVQRIIAGMHAPRNQRPTICKQPANIQVPPHPTNLARYLRHGCSRKWADRHLYVMVAMIHVVSCDNDLATILRRGHMPPGIVA